jgi:hypothetical protein
LSVLDLLRSVFGRRGAADRSTLTGDADSGPTLTGSFRGLNWADTRDNFQEGVLYLSGLGASDTCSSAATVARRIVGQMYSLTGANTVRMPINEPTIASYWGTYTGAIDAALARGKVILCYWAARNGKPADLAAFKEMWAAVVGQYGPNGNAFFEPINEPYGYSAGDLNELYRDWIGQFPGVPQGRVILDGSGYAQRPATVGADRRLAGCLLGYHEYGFFEKLSSEEAWLGHMRGDVGGYHRRVLCTEFGAVMNAGPAGGKTEYGALLDYSAPSSDKLVVYLRAVTSQFRAWGIGSVYWPGIRDDDVYRLCTRTGNGARIRLSINNASGLARIRYGWGEDLA